MALEEIFSQLSYPNGEFFSGNIAPCASNTDPDPQHGIFRPGCQLRGGFWKLCEHFWCEELCLQ